MRGYDSFFNLFINFYFFFQMPPPSPPSSSQAPAARGDFNDSVVARNELGREELLLLLLPIIIYYSSDPEGTNFTPNTLIMYVYIVICAYVNSTRVYLFDAVIRPELDGHRSIIGWRWFFENLIRCCPVGILIPLFPVSVCVPCIGSF